MSYLPKLKQTGRENVRKMWERSECKHLEMKYISSTRMCKKCRCYFNKNVADVINELNNGVKI